MINWTCSNWRFSNENTKMEGKQEIKSVFVLLGKIYTIDIWISMFSSIGKSLGAFLGVEPESHWELRLLKTMGKTYS